MKVQVTVKWYKTFEVNVPTEGCESVTDVEDATTEIINNYFADGDSGRSTDLVEFLDEGMDEYYIHVPLKNRQ